MRYLPSLRAALLVTVWLGQGFNLVDGARPLPPDAERVGLFDALASS